MKTNKIFSLLAVLVLGLAMVGLASGTEELDQYQTTDSTTIAFGSNTWLAQTFTAGKTGPLTKIVLKTSDINPYIDDLTVELRDIGSSGEPGSEIYASTYRIVPPNSENEFIFSKPYTVTTGTQYAIVIHKTNLPSDDSNMAILYFDKYNLYNGGQLWSNYKGGSWNILLEGNTDLYFKTYVDVTTPEPIPEFSTLAIPVAAILGLLFLFSQRRKKEK